MFSIINPSKPTIDRASCMAMDWALAHEAIFDLLDFTHVYISQLQKPVPYSRYISPPNIPCAQGEHSAMDWASSGCKMNNEELVHWRLSWHLKSSAMAFILKQTLDWKYQNLWTWMDEGQDLQCWCHYPNKSLIADWPEAIIWSGLSSK